MSKETRKGAEEQTGWLHIPRAHDLAMNVYDKATAEDVRAGLR